MTLVWHVRGYERFFERRPARVDALIHLGRLDHQGSPDLRYVRHVGSRAVERHPGSEVAQACGKMIYHATAVAEADCPDLAGGLRTCLQKRHRGNKVFACFGLIELREELARLVFAARVTTQRKE